MTGYLYRGSPWLEHANAIILAARAGTPYEGPRQSPGHGTSARYRRHLRDGEQPCQACLDAERQRTRARGSGLSASESARARWDRRKAADR